MSHPLQSEDPTPLYITEPSEHVGSNTGQTIIESWHDIYDQDPERDRGLLGQNVLRETVEVDGRTIPDFLPKFGYLDVRSFNERNARRNKLTYLNLDTNNLFNPQARVKKLDDLGAKSVTTTTSILDATSGLPNVQPDSLLKIEESIRHFDRAHAIKEESVVEEWLPLETKIKNDPEAGGAETVVVKQVVDNNTALSNTSTTISSKLEQISENKALRTVKSVVSQFRQKVSYLFTDSDALGSKATLTEVIKDLGFVPPALGYLDISEELLDRGDGKLLWRKKSVTEWPIFIDSEEEPETGKKVTIKRQIHDVNALPALVAGRPRLVKTLKNLDSRKALVITREIDEEVLSYSFEEWHNVSYYFPSYLDPDLPFSVADPGDTSLVSTNRSSDHNLKLPCKFVITYHATVPEIAEVFQFKPVDLKLVTENFTVSESDVLTDPGVLNLKMRRNEYYSFNIPASSPTASEYLSMMENRDLVLIGDDVTRWKFNLWKRIQVFLRIPDISQTLGGYLSY